MEKKVSVYKKKIVKDLTSRLKKSKNVFVANYAGLKNKELEELRNSLRDISSEFIVVKNSLSRHALKESKLDDLSQILDGATGLSFGEGDIVTETKTLVKFSKDHELFKIKGAISEGRLYSKAEIEQLALLPSREILLTKTVASMKAPINNLVFVLKENLRKITSVMDAISKKK